MSTETDFNKLRLTDGYWYMATPYSKWHAGIDDACKQACLCAGSFITRGVHVYSPIAHTHPIALACEMDPLDHKIWLPADKPMFHGAHGLLVMALRGWHQSFGIQEEISWARDHNKPRFLVDESFSGFTPIQ